MPIIRCTCTQTSKGTEDATLNWHDIRFHALEHARGCGYGPEVIRRIQMDYNENVCVRWGATRNINDFVRSYLDVVA